MTNWRLINEVVEYLSEIYEAEHTVETRATIEKRVIEWYNHTDITDKKMLVAAAWLGSYHPSISYNDIKDARDALFLEVYFPAFDGISIEEIEMALRDEEWR